MLAGGLAILELPVEQYPKIAPPAVTISATYPGASAKTLEDAVTQVIEQKMTGIDNLRYMSSTSDSSGQASITLTFEPVADPRSEEHTSELQPLMRISYAVFCLKNKKQTTTQQTQPLFI